MGTMCLLGATISAAFCYATTNVEHLGGRLPVATEHKALNGGSCSGFVFSGWVRALECLLYGLLHAMKSCF